MHRHEVKEFHHITHIRNVPSILNHGILSHNRAVRMGYVDISMEEAQNRRANKLALGKPLHDYANVYFTARNPMLFKRRERHQEICVLRVTPAILDKTGVIVADCNAASPSAHFTHAPDGLHSVDYDLVFSEYWTHPEDSELQREHRLVKCSEVLVPNCIGPECILGAYVSGYQAWIDLMTVAPQLSISEDSWLFFFQA